MPLYCLFCPLPTIIILVILVLVITILVHVLTINLVINMIILFLIIITINHDHFQLVLPLLHQCAYLHALLLPLLCQQVILVLMLKLSKEADDYDSNNVKMPFQSIFTNFQPDQPVLLCRLQSTVQEHIQEDHEGRLVLQMRQRVKNPSEDFYMGKLIIENAHKRAL